MVCDGLQIAGAVVVGFLGLLRPDEIFQLRLSRIRVVGDYTTIYLQDTKTSVRKKAYEVVGFRSGLGAKILSELK